MKSLLRSIVFFLTWLLALEAWGQPEPHIAYIYPAGGRAGTALSVIIGGQSLQNISNAIVSGEGIQAAVVEHHRPMQRKEFEDLRDQLKQLQEKRRNGELTPADGRLFAEIRDKLLADAPNREVSPALAQWVVLRVSIATNVATGAREVRLKSPAGLSNPLKFYVNQIPEYTKTPGHTQGQELRPLLERLAPNLTDTSSVSDFRARLPAVLNGQIMPAGVDRYHFYAQKGRRLVFRVLARQLIPYLADAVPGWFEAVLAIYDSAGHEVAYEERFRFQPDPVLAFEVPKDGDYILEIKDSIYRGREDFVYRIEAGELPLVTDIFPLGGRLGGETTVKLSGWNLSETRITVTNTEEGIHPIAAPGCRAVNFSVDTLPEVNQTHAGRELTLPVIVNGVIAKPGESHQFHFTGKAGMRFVAEVTARRLGSPLDSTLELLDPAGHRIAFNDDYDDGSGGLETHHADSYIFTNLPAAGVYTVRIADAQDHGGADYAYRLRLSEPRPDFALRVTPSSLAIRAGLNKPVTVRAIRKDGFTNAIVLQLTEASKGFGLSGGVIPANQTEAHCTIKAPVDLTGRAVDLAVEGRAAIEGKVVKHTAIPAEDMMQAFAYQHLVPSDDLKVAVLYNPRPQALQSIRLLTRTPLKISASEPAVLQFATPSSAFIDRFDINLTGAPDGIALQKVSRTENGVELALSCDGKKVHPGLQGNFIVSIVPKAIASNAKAAKRKESRRGPGATLPAIPFETVE